MDFRIADTFTDSLARMAGDEQKAVKTTAFDLQLNPSAPGHSFHKLDRARDPNFWSVRVSADIRLIVHRSEGNLLLCYVDHHDKAYDWASRRKLETHPKTGAAQWVEIRETVREVVVLQPTEAPRARAPKYAITALPFAQMADGDLLAFGVPPDWVEQVKRADEDGLLDLAGRLPAEAAEALLEIATGGKPVPSSASPGGDPFAHPDAQRRFRVVGDVEALRQALDYPWDKWLVFLHPAQRQLVERDYAGPARVSGSAGTGKTIVALHRAVHLARRNPDARVLLSTFSETLANALRNRLRKLIAGEPRLHERIEVHAMEALGDRLSQRLLGRSTVATAEQVDSALLQAANAVSGHTFKLPFLRSEWLDVVDAWQLLSWEAYRDVRRLGRKTRLSETQRLTLWRIFEKAAAELEQQRLVTRSAQYHLLAERVANMSSKPYQHIVIDEAQDIGIGQLRLLASLSGDQPNGLFFAGDLGQRIFQQPFSWKALGVDVRGRSRNLKVNYRTSHQIRMQADLLLEDEVADVDGNTESRRGTTSVFNGPAPLVRECTDSPAEQAVVSEWLRARATERVASHEIGVIVRSPDELPRAIAAVQGAGMPFKLLDQQVDTVVGSVSIGTMHLAKGLEFRAVAVMACDDEILPLQSRIENISDEADLAEVYATERHLLYVACTRAREHLLVTSVRPASEFLADLL